MKNLDFTDKEKVVIIGTAKQYNNLTNTIKNIMCSLPKHTKEEIANAEKVLGIKKKKKNTQNFTYNNTIFICFGNSLIFSNFDKYYDLLKELNNTLINGNSLVLFIRGNNDNPLFFETDFFEDKGLTNLKTISDYTIIKTSKHNILCSGGATSFDRQWKKNREKIINKYETNAEKYKHLYFPNEGFIFNDDIKNELNAIISEGLVIDTIVSQATPKIENYAYPNYLIDTWKDNDSTLINDIENEQNLLKSLFETVNKTNNIKCWVTSNYGTDSVRKNDDIVYFSPRSGRIEELGQIILIGNNKSSIDLSGILSSFKKSTPIGTTARVIDPFEYFDATNVRNLAEEIFEEDNTDSDEMGNANVQEPIENIGVIPENNIAEELVNRAPLHARHEPIRINYNDLTAVFHPYNNAEYAIAEDSIEEDEPNIDF